MPAKPGEGGGDHREVTRLLAETINGVNRLVARGFYCSIDGRHHPYGEQTIRKTMARLTAVRAQISTWGGANRELVMSRIGSITAHWLQTPQSEECGQRSVWGDADLSLATRSISFFPGKQWLENDQVYRGSVDILNRGRGDLGMCPAVADRWHLLSEVAALSWPVVQIGEVVPVLVYETEQCSQVKLVRQVGPRLEMLRDLTCRRC